MNNIAIFEKFLIKNQVTGKKVLDNNNTIFIFNFKLGNLGATIPLYITFIPNGTFCTISVHSLHLSKLQNISNLTEYAIMFNATSTYANFYVQDNSVNVKYSLMLNPDLPFDPNQIWTTVEQFKMSVLLNIATLL